MRRILLAGLCLLLLAPALPSRAATAFATTSVFAQVPTPGHPDTSIIAPDGSVIVSTNRGARGSQGPSKLFRFTPQGRLVRTYVVSGQGSGDHGLMGMAFDAAGRLYVADYSPPRILRIDLRSGRQQTYASIPDLPGCTVFVAGCDNGVQATVPWPDGLAFMKDGTLLVTDLAQGTVFAVANGARTVKPWLQRPELRSSFGPNQLQFDTDGTLLLDVTASLQPTLVGRGVVYRVKVDHGQPTSMTELFATNPGEGPDGFAVGRSGKIYLCTLITDRIIVLDRTGHELTAITGTLPTQQFDSPSSATFLGTDLLVTNLTYVTDSAAHSQVLRVATGDRGVASYAPGVR